MSYFSERSSHPLSCNGDSSSEDDVFVNSRLDVYGEHYDKSNTHNYFLNLKGLEYQMADNLNKQSMSNLFSPRSPTTPRGENEAIIFAIKFCGKHFGEVGLFEPDISVLDWEGFKMYLFSSLNLENPESFIIYYSDEETDKIPIESEAEYKEALKIAKDKSIHQEKFTLDINRNTTRFPSTFRSLVSSGIRRVNSVGNSARAISGPVPEKKDVTTSTSFNNSFWGSFESLSISTGHSELTEDSDCKEMDSLHNPKIFTPLNFIVDFNTKNNEIKRIVPTKETSWQRLGIRTYKVGYYEYNHQAGSSILEPRSLQHLGEKIRIKGTPVPNNSGREDEVSFYCTFYCQLGNENTLESILPAHQVQQQSVTTTESAIGTEKKALPEKQPDQEESAPGWFKNYMQQLKEDMSQEISSKITERFEDLVGNFNVMDVEERLKGVIKGYRSDVQERVICCCKEKECRKMPSVDEYAISSKPSMEGEEDVAEGLPAWNLDSMKEELEKREKEILSFIDDTNEKIKLKVHLYNDLIKTLSNSQENYDLDIEERERVLARIEDFSQRQSKSVAGDTHRYKPYTLSPRSNQRLATECGHGTIQSDTEMPCAATPFRKHLENSEYMTRCAEYPTVTFESQEYVSMASPYYSPARDTYSSPYSVPLDYIIPRPTNTAFNKIPEEPWTKLVSSSSGNVDLTESPYNSQLYSSFQSSTTQENQCAPTTLVSSQYDPTALSSLHTSTTLASHYTPTTLTSQYDPTTLRSQYEALHAAAEQENQLEETQYPLHTDSDYFINLMDYDAKFISDENVPDGTEVAPGLVFSKSWIVMNTGNLPWNERTTLSCTNADYTTTLLPVKCIYPCPPLQPGESGRITVECRAPRLSGIFENRWIFAQHGAQFGNVLWCSISVSKVSESCDCDIKSPCSEVDAQLAAQLCVKPTNLPMSSTFIKTKYGYLDLTKLSMEKLRSSMYGTKKSPDEEIDVFQILINSMKDSIKKRRRQRKAANGRGVNVLDEEPAKSSENYDQHGYESNHSCAPGSEGRAKEHLYKTFCHAAERKNSKDKEFTDDELWDDCSDEDFEEDKFHLKCKPNPTTISSAVNSQTALNTNNEEVPLDLVLRSTGPPSAMSDQTGSIVDARINQGATETEETSLGGKERLQKEEEDEWLDEEEWLAEDEECLADDEEDRQSDYEKEFLDGDEAETHAKDKEEEDLSDDEEFEKWDKEIRVEEDAVERKEEDEEESQAAEENEVECKGEDEECQAAEEEELECKEEHEWEEDEEDEECQDEEEEEEECQAEAEEDERPSEEDDDEFQIEEDQGECKTDSFEKGCDVKEVLKLDLTDDEDYMKVEKSHDHENVLFTEKYKGITEISKMPKDYTSHNCHGPSWSDEGVEVTKLDFKHLQELLQEETMSECDIHQHLSYSHHDSVVAPEESLAAELAAASEDFSEASSSKENSSEESKRKESSLQEHFHQNVEVNLDFEVFQHVNNPGQKSPSPTAREEGNQLTFKERHFTVSHLPPPNPTHVPDTDDDSDDDGLVYLGRIDAPSAPETAPGTPSEARLSQQDFPNPSESERSMSCSSLSDYKNADDEDSDDDSDSDSSYSCSGVEDGSAAVAAAPDAAEENGADEILSNSMISLPECFKFDFNFFSRK